MATDTDAPVALITQAGDYVGAALSRLLFASGHRLVLHRAPPELVDELRAGGATVEVAPDISVMDRAGNQTVVDAAIEAFGRIDAACFITGRIVAGRFLDMADEQWDFVKRANLDMPYYALQAVLPPMVEAGYGNVVVFTSATGANPQPGVSIYSGTRAGANALVRAVGLEFAPRGVCVNAIGTNYMDFPGFLQATGADQPEGRAKVEAQVPLRRLGTMDELAEFTSVLLDGRSRFQAGQFFSFSGGWSA
jgi:NAD(P)-dependent dehydrogenase (short-subunit alcohol dehydrogenase family)